MIRAWLAALILVATPVVAAPLEALKLQSEHPVDDMAGGNLSGLAMCNGQLWTVSDRDDDVLYSLDVSQDTWKAQSHHIGRTCATKLSAVEVAFHGGSFRADTRWQSGFRRCQL